MIMSSIVVLVTSSLAALCLLAVARRLWKQSLEPGAWLDDEIGRRESAALSFAPPSAPVVQAPVAVEPSAATVRLHPDSDESTCFFSRAELPEVELGVQETTEILPDGGVPPDPPAREVVATRTKKTMRFTGCPPPPPRAPR